MKSSVFWDIRPCGQVKGSRYFERVYRLHLHGQSKRSKNQRNSSSKLSIKDVGKNKLCQAITINTEEEMRQ
jgi:hypothetical protein